MGGGADEGGEVKVRCLYCGRTQFPSRDGGCVSCGAALPPPRYLIDITSHGDAGPVYLDVESGEVVRK